MQNNSIFRLTGLIALGMSVLGPAAFGQDTADLYVVRPMKHEVLDGTKLPSRTRAVDTLSLRVCRGEFEPVAFMIDPSRDLADVLVEWSDLLGSAGSIPASRIDGRICKVWWVAHPWIRMGHSHIKKDPSKYWKPLLTQELLVHDDRLMRVDRGKVLNELRIRDLVTGKDRYVAVSEMNTMLPKDGFEIHDALRLAPFDMSKGIKKQIWLTVHVPEDAEPGVYRSQVTVKEGARTLATFPLDVEVLPFDLAPSGMHFGLYYRGWTRPGNFPPNTGAKSEEQFKIELKDMKDHGYLYPGLQPDIEGVPDRLDTIIRCFKEVGLPLDRIMYQRDSFVFAADAKQKAAAFKTWNAKFKQLGVSPLMYCYGRDEARGGKITAQLPMFDLIHENGGKTWASISVGQFEYTKGKIDVAVLHGGTQAAELIGSGFDVEHREEIRKYHEIGAKVLSYAHPFAGQESAELYRRNFGLALWKAGYDGAMNFTYQWNGTEQLFKDFQPNSNYRALGYTHPITDGVLSTISWEGCREGVDDIRYLRTLTSKIEKRMAEGADVAEHTAWLKEFDPFHGDLDEIRAEIIDRILVLEEK